MATISFNYNEIYDNFDNCLRKLLRYHYCDKRSYDIIFTRNTASTFLCNLIGTDGNIDFLDALNRQFFKGISPIIFKRINYLILINDICLQANENMLNNLLLKGNDYIEFQYIFRKMGYKLNTNSVSFLLEPFGSLENTSKITSNNPDKNSFESIAQSQIDLYKKKNSDYGSATDKLFQKHGFEYYQIMLEQKMERINSLTNKNNQHNFESLEDTLLDLSNYAILAVESLRKHKKQD